MLSTIRVLKPLALSITAAALVLSSSGCQSPRESARGEMLSQAGTFREQLEQMPAMIDDTKTRLLAATSGQNPSRADDFREFSRSLSALREKATLVGREANIAEVNAENYFAEWAKEARRTKSADRPEVREAAAASRAQTDQALGYLTAARKDFAALITSLTNVETRLKASLSDASVAAAQPDVSAAISQSLDVRNRIDRLDEVIDAALAVK